MRSRLRFVAAFVILALPIFAPDSIKAEFNLAITRETDNYGWGKAVDPRDPVGVSTITYYVLRKFGLTNPLSGGTTIAIVANQTSINFGTHSLGTFCAVVRASNTISGLFDNSVVTCHCFVNKGSPAEGENCGVTRTDSAGQQLGFDQRWYFKYYLDEDAEVTLRVFPPNTPLSVDTSGFLNVSGNPAPTKVLVDHVPRSGEMYSSGYWKNTDIWDSRDSSGTTVPNGIYIGQIFITSPLLSPTTRHISLFTIPVDIIRFTEFNTVGISPTSPLGRINYAITGDSTVRIVVAKPGRKFTYDSNGDVQPLNAAGTAMDTSTNSVVQVLTYNKKAGTYAEAWNGTDTSGVSVSSGIYSVGVSAKDAFNNIALNLSSNHDGPVVGTIPVERTASQSAIDTTAPSVSAISVSGVPISLSGGTSINIGFTTLVATLNEVAGTGTNESSISLSGPAGAVAGGTIASSSNTVTYSTATTQTSSGTYTITITARDTLGNASSAANYTFQATTDTVAPVVASISVNGSSISLVGASGFTTPFTTVVVALNEPSGTGPYVSTVTLAGPAGAVAGSFAISSNTLTFTAAASQSSTGTYTVTVTARDSNGNTTLAANYTFGMSATSGSPGTQTPEDFKATVKAYPNPVRRAPLSVDFTLGASATVDFDVFNILGERLFHKTVTYAAGSQTYTWNLVNDFTARVGNGVYLFRITANDGRQTLKVTKKVMVIQ